jgi:hypothetical protein
VTFGIPQLLASQPRVPSSALVARSDGLLAVAFGETDAEEQIGDFSINVATCQDPCASWTTRLVASPTGDVQNNLPALGIDAAGTLYAVWTAHTNDGHYPLQYSFSSNSGLTWSPAVTVPTTFPDGAAAFPWIAGGSGGRIGLAYLATPASAFAPNAPWYVSYSLVQNATSSAPSFLHALVAPSPVVEMAGYPDKVYIGDFVTVDAMRDGSAIVAYAKHAPDDPSTTSLVAIQSAGPLLTG